MASMVMERPTGAGNAKEKVKKQLIYDHLVRRQMEDGLGSFWRSVLWIINEVEGHRGTRHKAKATEASGGLFGVKLCHSFAAGTFFLQGEK